jgi:hypothetical protein
VIKPARLTDPHEPSGRWPRQISGKRLFEIPTEAA